MADPKFTCGVCNRIAANEMLSGPTPAQMEALRLKAKPTGMWA